jgi:predicted phage terminase large subunit-like protein
MLLSSRADIRVYGGGAGGGKSFAILLDPLRYIRNPHVRVVSFRRTGPQLTQAGGLWETARSIYGPLGGIARENPNLDWRFKGGFSHKFGHLQHESDVYKYQGAQITVVNFDEATHFTKKQFWYLRSRIRGAESGVRGYMNLTCNPDPDWWGLELIGWYIDEDGFSIPERAGKLRFFIRSENDDRLVWANTKEELIERYPKDGKYATSVTFIPSKLTDNPQLLNGDPAYLANLKGMCLVDRERLLGGNWKIRESAGNMFRRGWFPIVEASPANAVRIRYWDRAGSAEPEKIARKTPDGGPDWTVGTRVARGPDGIFYHEHVHRFRGTPGEVEREIKAIASQDGPNVSIGIEQDPGQAGKADAEHYIKVLAGYDVRAYRVSTNKIVRAKPHSAQAEAGNVRLVRGEWNEPFIREHENFGSGKGHDDQIDSASGGVNALCEMYSSTPRVG